MNEQKRGRWQVARIPVFALVAASSGSESPLARHKNRLGQKAAVKRHTRRSPSSNSGCGGGRSQNAARWVRYWVGIIEELWRPVACRRWLPGDIWMNEWKVDCSGSHWARFLLVGSARQPTSQRMERRRCSAAATLVFPVWPLLNISRGRPHRETRRSNRCLSHCRHCLQTPRAQ